MNTRKNDEALLIDSHLHQLDEKQEQEVRSRVAQDTEMAALDHDVANALGALNLLPEYDGPPDLVQKTLARIAQVRQTDALIAREELGRTLVRPTFSLREVMVIAASILVIAVVSVPAIREARRVSQIGQCASNMGQVGTALQMHANANNGFLPAAVNQPSRWMPSGKFSSNSSALFQLVQDRYARQLVFLCPAAECGGPFQATEGMSDFPSSRNVHYSYQHSIGRPVNLNDPALIPVGESMAILADRTPFYRDGRFQAVSGDAVSQNHNRTGQNVLYLTGVVEWARQSGAGVRGNNIYLAEGIYNYRGDEKPVSVADSFLLPSCPGN